MANDSNKEYADIQYVYLEFLYTQKIARDWKKQREHCIVPVETIQFDEQILNIVRAQPSIITSKISLSRRLVYHIDKSFKCFACRKSMSLLYNITGWFAINIFMISRKLLKMVLH